MTINSRPAFAPAASPSFFKTEDTQNRTSTRPLSASYRTAQPIQAQMLHVQGSNIQSLLAFEGNSANDSEIMLVGRDLSLSEAKQIYGPAVSQQARNFASEVVTAYNNVVRGRDRNGSTFNSKLRDFRTTQNNLSGQRYLMNRQVKADFDRAANIVNNFSSYNRQIQQQLRSSAPEA